MFFSLLPKKNCTFLIFFCPEAEKKPYFCSSMYTENHTSFTSKLAYCIDQHHLLGNGAVLVALSGGADSVALLRGLLSLGHTCVAAHCNFQLRGEESDRDQRFVEQLCRQLGVALKVKVFNTKACAQRHHISLEMAARNLRYDFFEQLRSELGIDYVAVAHHLNDNAETMLLNLVRGTGIKGLLGMSYKRGAVVRPMLDIDKAEILNYLESIHQDYVTDSSNLVADVKRNIIRLELMPLLRKLNPAINQTLVAGIKHLREVYETAMLHSQMEWSPQADGSLSLDIERIPSHLALFESLYGKGFSPSQIDNVWCGIKGGSGALFRSPSHELLRDRGRLILREASATASAPLPAISMTYADAAEFESLPKRADIACLDADLVGQNIEVRLAKQGDRFVPLGMTGTKLVSDYLTDVKADRFSKQNQQVVTNGRDIVWLVGHRIDHRYRVVAGRTTRLLVCKINNQQQ